MIVIADTGGANIGSVEFALKRLGQDYKFAKYPDDLEGASKIILPGVGNARDAMERLKISGLGEAVKAATVPVLGICLGMQIMYEYSEEGNVQGLGLIPGRVKKIESKNLAVPHMGWNALKKENSSCFDFAENSYVYFVHSYMCEFNDYVTLYVDYEEKIPAMVNKENFYGMQFHPEKSSKVGEQLLKRFIEI